MTVSVPVAVLVPDPGAEAGDWRLETGTLEAGGGSGDGDGDGRAEAEAKKMAPVNAQRASEARWRILCTHIVKHGLKWPLKWFEMVFDVA